MMPPRRETMSIDAAIISTDAKVGAELLLSEREIGSLEWSTREHPNPLS
jgi:hypothetical protein